MIQETLAYGMEENWVLCMFCYKQSNMTEIQVSGMQHWIVCYNILRFITPACIPEDQLTLYWESRAYRYK
jgi:hypothetical protein